MADSTTTHETTQIDSSSAGDSSAKSRQPILEARGIHKRFFGIKALQDVHAAFYPGEVVAVMGENGAGKSTLMKCLAGVHQPTEGEIYYEGEPTVIRNVAQATELGIAFIHQELNLAENLTVGANIFLGREPRTLGFINNQEIESKTTTLLHKLGIDISSTTLVQELSIGRQQMVEIAKALSQDAKLLIMDEPTSSLTQAEVEILFEQVRELRAAGMCVVFISHRMAEVEEIADRVIVLRDGQNSGELSKENITHDQIVSLMVGRDLDLSQKTEANERGAERIRITKLRSKYFPNHEVSFHLHAGEIVGMAGLVGAGRTELARTLFGIDPAEGGKIEMDGDFIRIQTPRDAIAQGIALVPEDRKEQGIILDMAIKDNAAMPGLPHHQKWTFVKDGSIRKVGEEVRQKLNVKSTDVDQPVGALSGGNQQKVVLGKWMALKPRVFILDEPTRGIDVMSKAEIYDIIRKMAKDSGAAILMISSDLEEILRIADRTLVMHEGALAGQISRDDMTEESIMNLATGKM